MSHLVVYDFKYLFAQAQEVSFVSEVHPSRVYPFKPFLSLFVVFDETEASRWTSDQVSGANVTLWTKEKDTENHILLKT